MKYIEVKVKHGQKEIVQNVRVPENAKEGEHIVFQQEVLDALAADKKGDKNLPPYFAKIVQSHRAKQSADAKAKTAEEDQLLDGTAEGESDETHEDDNVEGETNLDDEGSEEEADADAAEGEEEVAADENQDAGADGEEAEVTKATKKKKKKNKRG